MAIIGFNFTKISAERKEKTVKGKIDIKNNVAITNVEESKLSIGNESQKVAKFSFDFDAIYEPKIGSIKFTGEILNLGEAKKIDELIASWKKDKKLSPEITTNLINTILTKCNIQALILSQQINLPAPIPMPKVQAGKK